ncbi:hypothetical protein GCM10008015_09660 [Flavobacterium palustre]|uniref:ABM domain-containing protein n=2 Tax=Flavobacterium palustre TaxID=1476463 RepID=A0ABQ1HDK2_9FLAO|nr:hypothetical protein GCM10008015_09660 [Flavobacterium palustre]
MITENCSIFKDDFSDYLKPNFKIYSIMISITAIIKSKKENIEEVKKMVHNLVSNTRREAACVRYDLHYTENVFIIWEEWKDQAGLDIHNNQSYLINFIADSETLLAAPIQVYKTTQVM